MTSWMPWVIIVSSGALVLWFLGFFLTISGYQSRHYPDDFRRDNRRFGVIAVLLVAVLLVVLLTTT